MPKHFTDEEIAGIALVEPEEIGENGGFIGHTKAGDKVEVLPDDDDPTLKPQVLTLRRNDEEISNTSEELYEKIWYKQRKEWLDDVASEGIPLEPDKLKSYQSIVAKCKSFEEKYGLENLQFDAFTWGFLCGQAAALCWVEGSNWEEVSIR